MIGRFICAMGCLLLVGTAGGAPQLPPAAAAPAQQVAAAPEPVVSLEMDALAAMIAAKISAGKMTSVVVVGGANLENKVTELGVSLRDGLNESLARQAAGVRVLSTADVGDVLRRNRVSPGMIYCNPVSEWIAAYAQADVAIVIRLERVENGRAVTTVEIWDERKKSPSDKHPSASIPYAKFGGQLILTEAQGNSAANDYQAPLNMPAAKGGKDGVGMPTCVYCPKPEYSEPGRMAKFHGTIYMLVTVRPDGNADDILITRPLGLGLDALAIDTVLKWKFKSASDDQNRPMATRVPVEIRFVLN